MKIRKSILGVLACSSVLGVSFSSSAEEAVSQQKYSNDYSKGVSHYDLFNMGIDVPSSWTYSENTEKARHEFKAPEICSNTEAGILSVKMIDAVNAEYSQETAWESVEASVLEGFDIKDYSSDTYSIGECTGYIFDIEAEADKQEYAITCFTSLQSDQIYFVTMQMDVDGIDFSRDYARIMDTAAFTVPVDLEDLSSYETGITYDQLARTPDDYVGQRIKFTGTVAQVVESDSEVDVRLRVNGDYNTIIYCVYEPDITDIRILEDDTVTVYGLSAGTISYKSTIGGQITIPGMIVSHIELNN